MGISFEISSISDRRDEQSDANSGALMQGEIEHRRQEPKQPDMFSISEILDLAHEWNIRIMNRGLYHHTLDLACLSVAVFGELLCSFLGLLNEDKWIRTSKTNFLLHRLLEDGCCHIEIIRLREIADIGHIYYISNLDRPGSSESSKLPRSNPTGSDGHF